MLLGPVDITERRGGCKLTRHYVAFVAGKRAVAAKYQT